MDPGLSRVLSVQAGVVLRRHRRIRLLPRIAGFEPRHRALHNPGFHFRQYFPGARPAGRARLGWLDVGIEHRSNGQALEINSLEVLDEAIDAYLNDDHAYFDQLSQSSNHVSIEGRYELRLGSADDTRAFSRSPRCVDFRVQLKAHYFSTGTEIRPVDSVFQTVRIDDYDRARLVVADTFRSRWSWLDSVELGGEWIVGDEGLATDSANVFATLNLDPSDRVQLPPYIRAHTGPMGPLSNYTKNDKSWGIGVIFR